MNQAVSIARRPLHEQPRHWTWWKEAIDQVQASDEGVYTALLAYSLMSPMTKVSSAFANYQAELGATAILLAAERHRRRTGAWPESVADIGAHLLAKPPRDPYSGEPFRMEHRDGQLVVYSIGANREDEHGAYEPRLGTSGMMDDVGAAGWDVSLRRQTAPAQDEGDTDDLPPP